jgi:hypothetical protein
MAGSLTVNWTGTMLVHRTHKENIEKQAKEKPWKADKLFVVVFEV